MDLMISPNGQQNSGMQAYSGNNSVMASAEEAKAMQEVQAMCILAKRFPRDVTQCYTAVMKELERYSLAKVALYSYPRGGQTVTGASIRLLEVVARNFKNLKYGIKELSRGNGVSECESYCWDLEANNHKSIPFQIRHVRDTRQGPKPLTDERDIYEMVANFGTRRMRNCIQSMIPGDIMEDALQKAKDTIEKGDKSLPFDQRVRNMVLAFDRDFGVTQEMIEDRYKHPVAQLNKDEFVELFGIYNSLKDKQAKREEFFTFITADRTTPQAITDGAMKDIEESQRMATYQKVMEKVNAIRAANGGKELADQGIESEIKCRIDDLEKQPTKVLLAVFQTLKGLK